MRTTHSICPLFVPADRPERWAKALASAADAVIIDLEDAVPPDGKLAARENLLRSQEPTDRCLIRINGVGTPWHADDIAALRTIPCAGIVLPKAEMEPHIVTLRDRLPQDLAIVLLIETTRGLADARALAGLDGIDRLAFGSIDFCADLGCAHTREALLSARTELVLASRLAALPAPLDGVTTNIDDPGLVESEARHARELGFGGKLCIHPRQIEPTRRGFGPDAAELAWAYRVVAATEGAVLVDGAMVDLPVRIRAAQIIKSARYIQNNGLADGDQG